MRVRMLVGVSDERRAYEAGEVCEIADERVPYFLQHGFCEPCVESPESATVESSERAVVPRGRKRGQE